MLGLSNQPPDEFAVVDRPPLSMPPDYNLRPPRPGAPSPNDSNPAGTAAKALYGDNKMELVPQQGVTSMNVQNLSPAEQIVINQSNATQADPHIRSVIDREQGQEVVANRKLIDAILFWKEPKPEEKALVVNAPAERARIEAAQAKQETVTTGETHALARGKDVLVP